tara:strand:+ start:1555 stop:2082 length:528 start_codon:yes stop_codon:yes gene_type:complete
MAVIGVRSGTVTEGTTHANDSAYGTWNEESEGGVTYLITDLIDPSDTDAEILSPGIPGSLINGKKIIVGFNTVTAGADVASDFHIDGSIDGKNWVMIGSSLDDDTEPNVTGVQLYTVDLSDYTLPWYRLSFNDGTDNITTWQGKLFVGGLAGGGNTGLDVSASTSKIGGVGADPS